MHAPCLRIKLKHVDCTTSNQRGTNFHIASASLWISESSSVSMINISHCRLQWDTFKHSWQTSGPPVLYWWAGIHSVFQTVIMTRKIALVSIVFPHIHLEACVAQIEHTSQPMCQLWREQIVDTSLFSMANYLLFLAKSDKATAMAQRYTVATLLHLWCFWKMWETLPHIEDACPFLGHVICIASV